MIRFFIGFIVLAAVSFIAVWGLADVTYKQGKKERIKQEDQKWQERWNKDIERRLILCGEDSTIYDGDAIKVPRISFERFDRIVDCFVNNFDSFSTGNVFLCGCVVVG